LIAKNGQYTTYPGNVIELVDHVINNRRPMYIICQTRNEPPHLRWLANYFDDVDYWVHHVSWMTEKTSKAKDGEWISGFPHVHDRGAGTITAITYLTECEGGELAVWKEDGTEIVYSPKPGLVVFTDGQAKHGVKAVRGGDRMAIHTTGHLVKKRKV